MTLTDREKILVTYAVLLGLHGEYEQIPQDYAAKYQDDRDLWAALVEVNLIYRSQEP